MSPARISLCAIAFGFACAAQAATPKEIEDAIRRGTAYLKKDGGDDGKGKRDGDHLGARALAGLALLETGTPADDPAVKKITDAIRDASYSEVRTYQITLFILYLDRLGDPADRPLIQMLGVRLVAGQNANGGWTYTCVQPVPQATEALLRTKLGEATLTAGKKPPPAPAKPDAPNTPGAPNLPLAAGKLHAEVEKYRQSLLKTEGVKGNHDDNSNTQFGILGTWTARKHGVPVEHALDLIEKRFLATQTTSGGWPYSGKNDGSPSMTCAGLLGLAVAVGRREERLLKAEVPKPPAKKPGAPPAKPEVPPGVDPNDPFYNPPKPAEPAKKPDEPAKPKGNRPPDARDLAIKRGMDNLAEALAGNGGKGKRGNVHDLYFFWSLERVGVIYGVKKIGKTDWYEYGVAALLPAQNGDGSWGGRGGHGHDVDTAFALLFLARSNLVRDLSAKVQRDPFGTELRAGNGGPVAVEPVKPAPAPMPAPIPMPADPPVKPAVPVDPPTPIKPPADPKPVAGTTPTEIALELFRATGDNWNTSLKRVRDAKGPENTSALLAVIPLLEGDRKGQAREALAERLCRMNANSLRGMLKADDAELRRAAALACAMKDDKDHVADLIDALDDKDADVAKAARAGLKSLTGKDFATTNEWKDWFAKEKK